MIANQEPNNGSLKSLEPIREKIFQIPSATSNNLGSFIGNLSTVLKQKLDSSNDEKETLEYLYASIVIGVAEQPAKITCYSAFVSCVIQTHRDFVQGLVNFAVKQIESKFDKSDWIGGRIILQFLMDLVNVNVLALESSMVLLQTLFESINEVGAPNYERKDCFIGILLSCLPWIASALDSAGMNTQLDGMFTSIQTYLTMEARLKHYELHKALLVRAPFKVLSEGVPYPQVPLVQWLSFMTSNWLPTKKWPVAKAYEVIPELSVSHNVPPVTCLKFLLPLERPSSAVYAFSSISTVFLLSEADKLLERYLLASVFSDMVNLYAHNAETCAERLVEFAKEVPVDALPGIDAYELLVDTVFGEMLKLPTADHKLAYYNSLVVHLVRCAITGKIAQIPKALGKCFRAFWTYLDSPAELDVELQRRFALFFSYYLSNFNYNWNWEEWTPVASSDVPMTRQTVFLREVLELCCRYSSKERVEQALGEANKAVLSADSVGLAMFGTSELPVFSEGDSELDMKISSLRKANEELVYNEKQRRVPPEAYDAYEAAFKALQDYLGAEKQSVFVSIAVSVLVESGKASLGQVLTFIEKIGPQIKPLMVSDECRYAVLDVLYATLENNIELFEFVVDKFVNYRLIELQSLVSWLLRPTSSISKSIDRYFFWNIVRTNVSKLVWRKALLQSHLKTAQKARDDVERQLTDEEKDGSAELAKLREAASKVEMQYSKLSSDLKQALYKLFKDLLDLLDVYAHAVSAADKTVQLHQSTVSGFVIEFARYFQAEIRPQRTTFSLIFSNEKHENVKLLWSEIDNYLKLKV